MYRAGRVISFVCDFIQLAGAVGEKKLQNLRKIQMILGRALFAVFSS
jgi:hypothetical protein